MSRWELRWMDYGRDVGEVWEGVMGRDGPIGL